MRKHPCSRMGKSLDMSKDCEAQQVMNKDLG